MSSETINIPKTSGKETEEVLDIQTDPEQNEQEGKIETVTPLIKQKAVKVQNTTEHKRLKYNKLELELTEKAIIKND